MKKLMFAALAFSAILATPAAAVTVIGGTTLTDPVYNRTLSGIPPTALSAVGTAVHYTITPFTVSANGSYVFGLTSLTPYDTFLGLYATAFNPLAPLTNAIAADDDGGPGSDSAFTVALLAGTSYFAIASGFSNTDVGRYSLEITGPGTITIGGGGGAVPETSTWAMIITGFGIVGASLRRRRRTLAIA